MPIDHQDTLTSGQPGPEAGGAKKGFFRRHGFLLTMILVLVALRNGMVIHDMWQDEVWENLPESMVYGNFAFDVPDGTWRGWDAYFDDPEAHLGDEMFVSLPAIPLYLLAGNSLLVLCQVPILWSIALVVLTYHLAARYLNRDIARLATLLLVFACRDIQAYEIYPYCVHMFSSLFCLTGVLLLLRLWQSASPGIRCLCAALLGVVCGLGLFHSQIALLALACLNLFWFVRDRLYFLRKEFLFAVLGFCAGMIPFLYFGPHTPSDILHNLLPMSTMTPLPGEETPGILGTFSRAARVFWPISYLAGGALPDLWVALLGLGAVAASLLCRNLSRDGRLLRGFLLTYSVIYILGIVAGKADRRYYFHAIYPHLVILLAVGLHGLQTRWAPGRIGRLAAYGLVAGLCLVNAFAIARHFDPGTLGARLEKQITAKGCNFYRIRGLPYRPPLGLKTALGARVEATGIKTLFVSRDVIPKDLPRKIVYLTPVRAAACPLLKPEDYLIFALDVSYVGLPRLVDQIESQVPPKCKPFAYAGLAVYYVNDNWLSDLLKDFRAGLIDRKIPPPYQRYFYGELARKLLNAYRNDPDKAAAVAGTFGYRQRTWLRETPVVFSLELRFRRTPVGRAYGTSGAMELVPLKAPLRVASPPPDPSSPPSQPTPNP